MSLFHEGFTCERDCTGSPTAVLPLAAGVSVLLLSLLATVALLLRRRRRKTLDADLAGPSIVVYPTGQGSAPQFLTKEINFTLPTLRHAASLDDLGADVDAESDEGVDTDLLVPASSAHTQRSNSFSEYGLGPKTEYVKQLRNKENTGRTKETLSSVPSFNSDTLTKSPYHNGDD